MWCKGTMLEVALAKDWTLNLLALKGANTVMEGWTVNLEVHQMSFLALKKERSAPEHRNAALSCLNQWSYWSICHMFLVLLNLESLREHLEPNPVTISCTAMSVSVRVFSNPSTSFIRWKGCCCSAEGVLWCPLNHSYTGFTGFNQAKTQKFKSSLLSTKLEKILSLIIACSPNWWDVMLIVPVILVNVQYVLVPVNYLWTRATIMREKVIFHALKGILMNWLPPI